MAEGISDSLDLEALRSFVAVARLGTLAAAAEQRHRTVSALSMQIKRLEARLDTTLLIRGARGVSPTPAARPCWARRGNCCVDTMAWWPGSVGEG